MALRVLTPRSARAWTLYSHRHLLPRAFCTDKSSRAAQSVAEIATSQRSSIPRSLPVSSTGEGIPENLNFVRRREAGTLDLDWESPLNPKHSFSTVYLRDNCSCAECRHPETKQRQVSSFAIPGDIEAGEIQAVPQGLSITWANDGHESLYDWTWLRAHAKPSPEVRDVDGELQRVSFWDASIAQNPPSVPYSEVMRADDKGVKTWTSLIRKYGFCYVDGCPATPEATKKLLERIAFIQHTHYGGFWDFTSDLTKKDTAYTTLGLGAHTDTTYFLEPAGLQMFHLLSHTEGDGGSSLLVDGYRAADVLRRESEPDYKNLSTYTTRSHASGNADVSVQASGHVFENGDWGDLPENGDVIPVDRNMGRVRWNNDDRAAMLRVSARDVRRWYAAAKKWDAILKSPESEYWEQLRPGRPLIFDNWRVLHGRSAFSGKRRICGGYITMDDFVSRWRMTSFGREEVLKHV